MSASNTKTPLDLTVTLRRPHDRQLQFIDSSAKRKVIRAGRRSGKTTGVAVLAIRAFLEGRRILYATPTQDQVDRFWHECKIALQEPIDHGVYNKNETKHTIELEGTEQRIRGKTAWNADTLRGDYADLLILDEFQLMSEDTWNEVGAPMLLDNDGDAVFIFTQKRGKNHSKELYKRASEDTTGRWESFLFSSLENPYLSREALAEISTDMTELAYKAEILAAEVDDDPRALWNRDLIDRVNKHPELIRIAVGVDPQSSTGQTGIIVAGKAKIGDEYHAYILEDATPAPGVKPAVWGSAVVSAYHKNKADRIIGEVNHGGDMVENVIRNVSEGSGVAYTSVRASRGKMVRAEPIAALYEKGRIHHVGEQAELEDEMCNWVPGESDWSPNRVDAMVWVLTDLMLGGEPSFRWA